MRSEKVIPVPSHFFLDGPIVNPVILVHEMNLSDRDIVFSLILGPEGF